MKKFFGFFFLIIGIIGIGIGIVALTDLATRNRSLEGQFQNEFSENYSKKNNEQQAIGYALIGSGLIFSLLGIIMIASKSKKSIGKNAELDYMQAVTFPIPSSQHNLNISTQNTKIDTALDQIERLGKLKQDGFITEEEFNDLKKKCFI